MKHSKRDSERAEQDLAHLRELRTDTTGGAGSAAASEAGQPGADAGGGRGAGDTDAPPLAADTTGRAGGDPAAGTFGKPRFDEPADVNPDAVPRAPSGLSMPRASEEPPGTVVGPGGPIARDLPIPPAMQYAAGPPLGPLPGQHRGDAGSTGAGGAVADPPTGAPAGGASQIPGATATLAPPSHPIGTGEWVTCPECGESQTIDLAQRRAEDFCRRCDFPLFWARTAVVPLSTDDTGASLRRLPGTVGRAATASVPCPHCGEPNSPTAIICIRCSQPMVVVEPEPEPEPEPVYVPPPPEPEPEAGFPLWWVVGACVALVIITVIVAWIALAV